VPLFLTETNSERISNALRRLRSSTAPTTNRFARGVDFDVDFLDGIGEALAIFGLNILASSSLRLSSRS